MKGVVTVRKVVISLLLAGALAGFGYAFASGTDPKTPRKIDPAVERTEPVEGTNVPHQSRIGVDLVSGYTAQLYVDSRPIPDDQVEKVVGLDQYWYTPGPGTETGQLAPGRHCASVVLTKLATAGLPAQTGSAKSWCFSLN